MTDNVASLGFEVDSKPLDDAKQKLSDVATQADKTGQAVDKFNQTTAKTGDALRGGASAATGYAGPLGAIEAAARRAGLSVAEFQARTAAFRAETARLSSSSGAAGTAIGAIAREAGTAAPGMAALGAASKAAATEHAAHGAAANSLRGQLQGLNAVLGQFGGNLGGLSGLAASARLGIAGLAAAAGVGLLTAIEKVGDEVERTKNRLSGLTGSAGAGAKAFDAIKAAARASGVEASTLEGAFEKAKIGLDTFADKHVTYANTVENAEKANNGLISALGTVGTILNTNSATADQAAKALNALAASFADTGTLGVNAFRAIQRESPSTALAIANAFGFEKVADFVKELDKAPITIDEFVRRMALVKPLVDAGFDPEKPKNLDQALRGVSAAWHDMMEEVSKAGGFTVVKDALAAFGTSIKQVSDNVPEIKRQLDLLGGAERDFADNFQRDESKFSGWNVNVVGAVGSVLATLGRLPTEGIQTLTDFANGAIAQFQRMAAGAVSAAQTAANALAGIAKGGGGNGSSSGGVGLGEGSNPGNTDALGYPMGGDGGAYYDSGGGTGTGTAIDYGGVGDYLGDIPAFATGTDNAPGGLTRINEHGGEIVNLPSGSQVIPHDISMQMAGAIQGLTTLQAQTGIVSATPDPASMATVKEITDAIDQSTIDISKKVLEGSDSIVTALNKLTGAASAPVLDTSTGLPVSSDASRSSLGPSRTGVTGGGGFNTRGGGMGAEEAKAIAENAKNNPPLSPQQAAQYAAMGAGMVGGQGSSIKGFGGSAARRFQSRQPYTGGRLPYGGGSLPAFANPYYGPLDGTDYGYGGYETGYATIGDGYDYGTSPYNDYGYSDYAGYDTGYTGGDFGVGGSSFGDVANQYMGSGGYDYTSGGFGFDPGYVDYGGGSVDYGYFAKGGQFKVGGDGGVDTTLATLHLTKGETVTITPEGVPLPSTPDSIAMPATSSAPASDPSAQQASSQAVTKTINIHVQAGIQADSFIRSRAQIARGL